MKIKVLMLGADDIPGGISGYINTIADLCDAEMFEFHAAVSQIISLESSYLHDSFIKHILPLTYTYWSFPVRALQLRRIVRNQNIMLLHMHTARGGFLGCVATFALPIAKVYTGHSWRFEQKINIIERFFFRLYERYISHCSTRVTFLTKRDRDLGLRLGLIKRQKAIAINTRIMEPKDDGLRAFSQIITRAAYGIPENAKVIGNTGYLSDRKDPYTFVKAAARIIADIPDAYFLWVGDGELRHEVERLVRELGLARCFTITGFKPMEQVPVFLKLMDVLLFTSRIEGVPLTLLEAQLCGISVVSSAYPGIEEIVEHGATGLTFLPGDARQAADRVVEILSDDDLLMEMADLALVSAKENHSDPAKMADQYEEVYFDAIRCVSKS